MLLNLNTLYLYLCKRHAGSTTKCSRVTEPRLPTGAHVSLYTYTVLLMLSVYNTQVLRNIPIVVLVSLFLLLNVYLIFRSSLINRARCLQIRQSAF